VLVAMLGAYREPVPEAPEAVEREAVAA
jgi:hypothetical protein